MAEGKFKPGDVVHLASGGPSMTVAAAMEGKPTLLCVWFDKDDRRQADEFFPITLVAAKPKAKLG